MNFIRTQAKAEPTIFYLPKKQTKETEKLLEETRAAIKVKIDSLKDHLQPVPEAEVNHEEEALRASAAAAAFAVANGEEAPGAGEEAASAEEEGKEEAGKEEA